MKKILLCSIIPFSILSNSNDFLVIVDKDHNEYKIAEGIEKIEYSEWVDEGVPYNCINQNPLSNSIYEGTSFEQTSDCEQDETRDQFTYLENSITGEKVLISTKEENNTYNIVKKENIFGTYEAISCKDIISHNGNLGNGTYKIKPASTKFDTYCDMTNGGYTIHTMSSSVLKQTPALETECGALGLNLFVPRTEAHLTNAVKTLGAASFYMMGIYPNYKGATCINTPFNSNSCSTWDARDGKKWYVSSVGISEPNGDNDTTISMYYAFDAGTGISTWYNDIQISNTSSPGGYSTKNWACSASGEGDI